jgi:hypothetical protein
VREKNAQWGMFLGYGFWPGSLTNPVLERLGI